MPEEFEHQKRTTRNTQDTRIIGRNLLRLRKLQGLSQRDIANCLGTSFQQIQKYEKGENRISAERLYLLKNYLSVPYAAFFDGVGQGEFQRTESEHLQRLINRFSGIKDHAFKQKLLEAFMILSG